MKMIWCGWKSKENCHVLVNQFHGNFRSKTLGCRKIRSDFRDVKWCFNAILTITIDCCITLGRRHRCRPNLMPGSHTTLTNNYSESWRRSGDLDLVVSGSQAISRRGSQSYNLTDDKSAEACAKWDDVPQIQNDLALRAAIIEMPDAHLLWVPDPDPDEKTRWSRVGLLLVSGAGLASEALAQWWDTVVMEVIPVAGWSTPDLLHLLGKSGRGDPCF